MPSTDTVMSAQGTSEVTIEQLGTEYLEAELDRKTAQRLLDAAKGRRDKAAAGLRERLCHGQVFTVGPNNYVFKLQPRNSVGYKGAVEAVMAVADDTHRDLISRAVASNTTSASHVKISVVSS